MLGCENQRWAMRSLARGVQRLTTPMKPSTARSSHLGQTAGALVHLALRPDQQPGRAEQGIARHHAEAAHHREPRGPIERAAGELAVGDRDALDEAAQDHALEEGGQRGAEPEGAVPPHLAGARHPAELEGDAAEHQRQQHQDDREVERRHDHGVGLWEGHQQPAAAQHQPGLVAVPERRHRVDHQVAVALLPEGGKQDADAEVEAVEDHVHGDGDADQRGPDHRQIPFHRRCSSGIRFQESGVRFQGVLTIPDS